MPKKLSPTWREDRVATARKRAPKATVEQLARKCFPGVRPKAKAIALVVEALKELGRTQRAPAKDGNRLGRAPDPKKKSATPHADAAIAARGYPNADESAIIAALGRMGAPMKIRDLADRCWPETKQPRGDSRVRNALRRPRYKGVVKIADGGTYELVRA